MSILYNTHEHYPDSILIRNFTGEVNVDEIISSWDFLIKNDLVTNDLKGVINDLTKCELTMDENSFNTLIGYLKKHSKLKKLKLAVVCNDPRIIVFPILGESVKELNIKPFSTERAAVQWIIYE